MEAGATFLPFPDEECDDTDFDITIDPTLLQDEFYRDQEVADHVKKKGLMMILHAMTLNSFEVSLPLKCCGNIKHELSMSKIHL